MFAREGMRMMFVHKVCRDKMKHTLPFVFFALVTLLSLSPLHLSNHYLRCTDFDVVVARDADSVARIASRYTNDPQQVERLAEAIIDVNGLPPDGALRVGQNVRVPVLPRQEGAEVAVHQIK